MNDSLNHDASLGKFYGQFNSCMLIKCWNMIMEEIDPEEQKEHTNSLINSWKTIALLSIKKDCDYLEDIGKKPSEIETFKKHQEAALQDTEIMIKRLLTKTF